MDADLRATIYETCRIRRACLEAARLSTPQRPRIMANGFPCPNPACAHVFPSDSVKGASSLTCPKCAAVFHFRGAGADAPSPDAAPIKTGTPPSSPLSKPPGAPLAETTLMLAAPVKPPPAHAAPAPTSPPAAPAMPWAAPVPVAMPVFQAAPITIEEVPRALIIVPQLLARRGRSRARSSTGPQPQVRGPRGGDPWHVRCGNHHGPRCHRESTVSSRFCLGLCVLA